MTPTDMLVVAGGVAAIVWVNWYFFFAGKAAANTTGNVAAQAAPHSAAKAAENTSGSLPGKTIQKTTGKAAKNAVDNKAAK